MWVISLATFRFKDVNHMACLQYGYSREEFLSMTALDIRPREEWEQFRQLNRPTHTDASNYNKGVWRHLKKDGSIIRMEVISHEIEFEGEPCRLVAANNITEKLEAEEKLAASEQRLRHTLDHMMEGAQILDFDWKYVYVNDTLVQTSHYSREELIGATIMERFPGIEQTDVFKVMKRCMTERTAEHMENRFVFPNGNINYYQLSIQPSPEGLFILSIDITERVLADQRIRESEEKLKSIFDNVSEGFLLADENGVIKLFNDRIKENISGNIEHDISVGSNIFDYVEAGRQSFFTGIFNRVKSGEMLQYDREYVSHSGKKGWINLLFNPVYVDSIFTGICITSRDITEIKRLEAERIQQQTEQQQKISKAILHGQEKERNHIARELHDNVNQILAGARMYLAVAGTKSEGVKREVEYPIQLLDESVKEIRMLCSRMVSPSKNIALKELIQDLLIQMRLHSGIEIHYSIADGLELLPDELRLNAYRIMQELSNNINKYSKANQVTVDIHIKNGLFILFIEDNGRGFDVKAKKEGIGLSNIRSRVLSFGGSIDIRSEAGKGSSTLIEIPV